MGYKDTSVYKLIMGDGQDDFEGDYYDDADTQATSKQATTRAESQTNSAPRSNRNVVNMTSGISASNDGGKIVVFVPRIMSDANTIAQRMIEGEAAVVDFQNMDEAQKQRTLDFLYGVKFAIKGEIKQIGSSNVYLAVPQNFEVGGELTQTLKNNF
ncbi:DUF552 domain-containing protein [Weissella soli]|uniref:cell division protein SepF n=1 Tax=Weissella soli TaxID=155866 RepID=UPI0021C022EB|nr:cell division protein SepF [Weissella soli]MCT8394738.1 DUF552 domain-containing protein [Weissella soli]